MITAVVTNYIKFSGEDPAELIYSSGELPDSPDIQQLENLLDGDNEIVIPSFENLVVHGVVIIPPSGNIIPIHLRGDAGDVGIPLSASRATVLQFADDLPSSITLGVDEDLGSVRLVWF